MSTVLVSRTSTPGNHEVISGRVLQAIEERGINLSRADNDELQEQRRSIQYDDKHIFHMIIRPNKNATIIYLCLTSGGTISVSPRLCFGFLEAVCEVFQAKLGRAARVANAHGLEKSFGVELTSMMHRWNTAPPAVRDQGMVRVEGKIQGVKKVMHQNVKELLKREEAMEMLVDRTESLQEEAVVFKRRSEMVKEKMKQKYLFYRFLLVAVILLVILFLTVSVCGTFNFQQCLAGGSEE